MERYNAKLTEKKWQEEWEKKDIYLTDLDKTKEKYYVLEMFPYPSGKDPYGTRAQLHYGRRNSALQKAQRF
jgi:leucyl-tRNA synthetase